MATLVIISTLLFVSVLVNASTGQPEEKSLYIDVQEDCNQTTGEIWPAPIPVVVPPPSALFPSTATTGKPPGPCQPELCCAADCNWGNACTSDGTVSTATCSGSVLPANGTYPGSICTPTSIDGMATITFSTACKHLGCNMQDCGSRFCRLGVTDGKGVPTKLEVCYGTL